MEVSDPTADVLASCTAAWGVSDSDDDDANAQPDSIHSTLSGDIA